MASTRESLARDRINCSGSCSIVARRAPAAVVVAAADFRRDLGVAAEGATDSRRVRGVVVEAGADFRRATIPPWQARSEELNEDHKTGPVTVVRRRGEDGGRRACGAPKSSF